MGDSWDEVPGQTVRIEAAAYQGRPVFFRIVEPWTPEARTEPLVRGDFAFPGLLVFLVVIPAGAGVLAWKNNRMGLGDRRGAFRLAAFTFVCTFVRSFAGQHHGRRWPRPACCFAHPDALTVGAIVLGYIWHSNHMSGDDRRGR
jgi:hypothetical protein